MTGELKIAFVQDSLPFQGGAEKVLAAALEIYPQAPVYTLVYNREAFQGTCFAQRRIQASFIDRLPGAHKQHRLYLPLMPLALERFDLGSYDVVLSFSYAVAHAAPTHPGQLHLSYIHTPMRYAWRKEFSRQVLPGYGRLPGWFLEPFLSYFRRWDTRMLKRTHHFLTNSHWMAGCIWKAYRRPADVLYPPVDIHPFAPQTPRGNYYVYTGRLVAIKRLELVVEAFTRLGYPLLIIGEGPERARLEALAGPNIRFSGWLPQEQVAGWMGKAKAFVHAGEEDFGIAMAEAQASGCPVIALASGAAPEIVRDGLSGLLFQEQNVEALCAAVENFERHGVGWGTQQIRDGALRFDRECFQRSLENYIREKRTAFQKLPVDGQSSTLALSYTQTKAPARTSETNYGCAD
ncbi:MAG: glycosyltransferase [Omnitrophica WOR_2 bacterium]